MRCKHCGFTNGEDDHRCLRCGRRSAGVVISAPSSGANALALDRSLDHQPALFPASAQKVIPFDRLQRQVAGTLTPFAVPPAAEKRATPPGKSAAPAPQQTAMDFVRAGVAAPRVLRDNVPAQVYCDYPVAGPTHRFVAGAMDAVMILLAFGLFVELAQFAGGGFGEGKMFWIVMGASFALIAMFYGLVWVLADRETAGMNWTELQLVTFDGGAVERGNRVVRFASAWLSFCAAAAGVLWTIADEEKLAWHDHMSKTFPTVRILPRSFNRQRN